MKNRNTILVLVRSLATPPVLTTRPAVIQALFFNTIGGASTAIGEDALMSNTEGSGNIAVGVVAAFNVTTANSVICIGALARM